MLIEAWGEDGSLLAEALYSEFSIGMDSYRSDRASSQEMSMYRVTHHANPNLPLTSNLKFCFSLRPMY